MRGMINAHLARTQFSAPKMTPVYTTIKAVKHSHEPGIS